MEGNSIKSFENLCKIFETRIKLDREKNVDTPEDVLINYEKYSKKIDNIYNQQFEKDVKPLISPARDLEEEQVRLKKLIKLLEDRINKREELENRFYLTTGKYIKDLQIIVSESELNDKKDRLDLVVKYLDTNKEIESITESVAKLRNSLEEEERKKEEYSLKNQIMEDELNNSFIDAIKNDDYFNDINSENLDTVLVSVIDKVKETSETLEVTKDSVDSLIQSGADDDYTLYVEDAEKNYYIWKNREILLKIYEKIICTETDFDEIVSKRDKIDELVRERSSIRINLNITGNDELAAFNKILLEQISNLDGEKEILENISNYMSRIKFKEERLDELEKDINSVEMLSLLKEYNLIDTYDSDKIEDDTTILDNVNVEDDTVVVEEIDPYRIVEIKDYPKSLNIGLAKLKAESVRDKINKKLNPVEEIENNEEMVKEEIVPNIPIDIANSEEVEEDTLPSTDNDNEQEDFSMPTWKVPESSEINNSEPLPVWGEINNTPTDLPVWKNTNDKQDSSLNNNSFWVPVNDEPADNSSFVNINTPLVNDNGIFDFPNMNN